MQWNLEGKRVNGIYLGLWPFRGIVTNSRVKYGGRVQHTIKVAEPFRAYGELRETILVDAGELGRILDERDEEYGRSINDTWYDDQFELDNSTE
jgi:hypothetical protein